MSPSLPSSYAPGSRVYFGRSRGEQTLGEVVKVNRAKCKVRQLESRGTLKDHPVGTVWTVPFSLLTPAGNAAPIGRDEADREYEVASRVAAPTPKRDEQTILLEINGVYGALSPENLTCDGELPMYQVRKRASALRARLRVLFTEIGRSVGESESYEALRRTREANTM